MSVVSRYPRIPVRERSTDEGMRRAADGINYLLNRVDTIEDSIGTDTPPTDLMKWNGVWIPNDYEKNDVVRDGQWTMICAEDICNEKPAPTPIGPEFFIYTDTISETSVSAKTLITGGRYAVTNNGYITGYRVYQFIDFHYSVALVQDPLGTPIVTQLIEFTASATGWLEIDIAPLLIFEGALFDLLLYTNEPDDTPVEVFANYNYSVPNNDTVPLAGQITQSNKTIDQLWVNKTDDDSGTPAIGAMTAGDVIVGVGETWTVLGVADSGDYYKFTVAPASQGSPVGVSQFSFQTVTPTPISYAVDVGFNEFKPDVSGLYIEDGPYSSIAVNDNQYGVDLKVQEAEVSDQWEVVAFSGGAAGGGAPVLGDIVYADITNVLEVGYPTFVQTAPFGGGVVTPDLEEPFLKRLAVNNHFTLNDPTFNGTCSFYLIVTGGPWTVTLSGNTVFTDGNATINADTNYLLRIERYSATEIVANLVEIV